MLGRIFVRFLIAIGIFWAGLHLIGFGMLTNGSADPRNPIWKMVSSLFEFEAIVLKVLFYATVAVATLAMLRLLLKSALALWEWAMAENEREPQKNLPDRDSYANKAPKTFAHDITPVRTYPMTSTNSNSTPSHEPCLELEYAKPTPEELKQKAIEQILKGY